MVIFASVTLAMYFPQYFIKVGDFELKRLITPLLQIIMFGMGTTLSLWDFGRVIKMPRGVFVGVLCQFSIMPFVGWTIARSEEHTSELQSREKLVCRLVLEQKQQPQLKTTALDRYG